jgi:hypothetical protein
MQRMSTYTLGHGQYDDSYTIEDADGKFLGECGAGISETVGVGEPQRATAVEVWLFDKDDFVRTVTKVFVSAHAAADAALRSKLEARGDLILAEPGATVSMETASLRLQARIVELEYATDATLPPNSHFQRLTIELAAWRKEKASASQPAPQPVTTVPVPQTTPAPPVAVPVPPPSYTPPPSSPPAPAGLGSPARPTAAPPPPPPRTSPEDDPFGGTGDFTPIT